MSWLALPLGGNIRGTWCPKAKIHSHHTMIYLWDPTYQKMVPRIQCSFNRWKNNIISFTFLVSNREVIPCFASSTGLLYV
jgi:hypothetical protein